MTTLIVRNGNSGFITASGLKDLTQTPAPYVNNAALTGTLKDRNGVAVAGATNLPGVYQTASNGVYRFVLTAPINTVPGMRYTFVIDGTGDGATFHGEAPAAVEPFNGVDL